MDRQTARQTTEIMCPRKGSGESNKNIKRLNSLLTSELAMRGNRKRIKLYYNFMAEYLLFILVSIAYLQICRAPTDKSASQQDGTWLRIVTYKSAI